MAKESFTVTYLEDKVEKFTNKQEAKAFTEMLQRNNIQYKIKKDDKEENEKS
jgi:hypothetical protein